MMMMMTIISWCKRFKLQINFNPKIKQEKPQNNIKWGHCLNLFQLPRASQLTSKLSSGIRQSQIYMYQLALLGEKGLRFKHKPPNLLPERNTTYNFIARVNINVT